MFTRRELFVFMPAGLAFNAIAYAFVVDDPSRAVVLAWVQLALTFGFLANRVFGTPAADHGQRRGLVTAGWLRRG